MHWQQVAEKIVSSGDEAKEKSVFMKICSQIQQLDSSVSIIACFEALCGVRPVTELQKLIPAICKIEDARFIDSDCDWSSAKHWAQWWARCDHLKMLSKAFSSMEGDIWKQCPSMQWNVEIENARATHHNV